MTEIDNVLQKKCSGFVTNSEGIDVCKYGHYGPGMHVCQGSRYPDGTALAPCEQEDLLFDENLQRVTWKFW